MYHFQIHSSVFVTARELMSGTIFFQLIMGAAFISLVNFGFEIVSSNAEFDEWKMKIFENLIYRHSKGWTSVLSSSPSLSLRAIA